MDDGRIDDPAQMRALAHPTRLRILGLLRANGPQTAAMLGELIDEAPGTISYHCGKLAGAGFIEPADVPVADRRERWWQAAHASSSWHLEDALDDPERALAASTLDRAVARTYAANFEAYVDRAATFGREWVAAGTSSDRVIRLTAPELAQLGAEMRAVVERWRAVGVDHVEGDGSEQVVVLQQAYRWPRV
ncbi:ArsR family transcriptional regulator [Curtobacterium sp. PhB130]|uniref:ArsR/SmtB family transcription factor n=1 Tax=Curtobacterium sp. PhB130 TaxID=2485178 RepID=UPI000F4CC8E1|nr:helix-turn-helix domain-containing protein [Curtobacterium sp. PhB130]ROS77613.1 ArsR family transcriptional regulator [Curtobacterium sp. PhB130]